MNLICRPFNKLWIWKPAFSITGHVIWLGSTLPRHSFSVSYLVGCPYMYIGQERVTQNT